MNTYNVNINELQQWGYLQAGIPAGTDLRAEILRMKVEKNAVILGHYYIDAELQDISDYVGDSLGLSQQAARTKADMIVFLGVHFMAETAKILAPDKKVILPDLKAGCSLAESCPPHEFEAFIRQHPDHLVVSYVNTSAAIKALTDIVCTSTNAVKLIESLPVNQKIIFGPDYNLGNYINKLTGRDMLLWNGACHVHQQFSVERIVALKKLHPDAKVLAHPECQSNVLLLADYIGSTSGILNYATHDSTSKFIVATESGILHQMQKARPEKTFIPAPPEDSTCSCNDCMYMKLNSMKKLYNCLKYELPEITIEESLRLKAHRSIQRMLEMSEQLGFK